VGLDVYEREPRVPAALVSHPRVVCLPHLGSATFETRRRMAELALANALAVLAGRPPLTPVRE
jgi:glyoxylate reductase